MNIYKVWLTYCVHSAPPGTNIQVIIYKQIKTESMSQYPIWALSSYPNKKWWSKLILQTQEFFYLWQISTDWKILLFIECNSSWSYSRYIYLLFFLLTEKHHRIIVWTIPMRSSNTGNASNDASWTSNLTKEILPPTFC